MTTDLVPVGAGVSRAPMMSDYNMVWKFAKFVSDTEFVPAAMRRKDEVVFAAIAWGLEAGLGPMQAIRGVQVIEGQVGPKPELARALVMQRGHTFGVREWDDEHCTVYGHRIDNDEELTITYSLDDAVRAELVKIKDGKPYARSSKGSALPWEKHTRRMLLARATGDLCAALFPDVVAGLSYMADELAEIADRPFDVGDEDLPQHDDVLLDDGASATVEDERPGSVLSPDPGPAIVDAEVVGDDPSESLPEEPSPGVHPDPYIEAHVAEATKNVGKTTRQLEAETAELLGEPSPLFPNHVASAIAAYSALKPVAKMTMRDWCNAQDMPVLPANLNQDQAERFLARIGEGF